MYPGSVQSFVFLALQIWHSNKLGDCIFLSPITSFKIKSLNYIDLSHLCAITLTSSGVGLFAVVQCEELGEVGWLSILQLNETDHPTFTSTPLVMRAALSWGMSPGFELLPQALFFILCTTVCGTFHVSKGVKQSQKMCSIVPNIHMT